MFFLFSKWVCFGSDDREGGWVGESRIFKRANIVVVNIISMYIDFVSRTFSVFEAFFYRSYVAGCFHYIIILLLYKETAFVCYQKSQNLLNQSF